MNERPTPETDALILSKDGFGATNYEWREHSRKLERERDEAREALRELYFAVQRKFAEWAPKNDINAASEEAAK